MDLSVHIGSRIKLTNPIMPASGPLVGDAKKIRFLADQGIGALVTKTISVHAAEVPRPCIIGGNGYIINTELWSEFPPERWEQEFLPEIDQLSQPLIISLGYSKEDILNLIPRMEGFAMAFELSTHYSGKDLNPIAQIVESASSATGKPVFIKMSPHIPDPVEFARMVKDHGGYGVVATNSLGPVFPIDSRSGRSPMGSSDGYGWISGPVIKPLSLSVVRRIADVVDIPIIGVGGIASANDVLEFLMAGASAVQLLSAAMLSGKGIYAKILGDLPKAMRAIGVESLSSLIGTPRQLAKTCYEKRLPVIDHQTCTMCMRCVDNCAYFALESHDKRILVDEEACFGCGLCESRCPVKAISGVL